MAPESVKDLFTLELTALGGGGGQVETASLVESERSEQPAQTAPVECGVQAPSAKQTAGRSLLSNAAAEC